MFQIISKPTKSDTRLDGFAGRVIKHGAWVNSLPGKMFLPVPGQPIQAWCILEHVGGGPWRWTLQSPIEKRVLSKRKRRER